MSKSPRLVYLPLGGAGEIGMNMYLYGYGLPGKERWIMVDCGVTFPNMESSPGVDLIMADSRFIEERREQLDGIFITHAHEDHIGALGLLHARLGAPVFTRRFTGIIAHNKLDRVGIDADVVEVLGAYPEQIELGPFKVGFLPVAHSIPEASGLVIDTPAGRIVHSGDFKTDIDPGIGEPFDPAVLKEIGESGVHAFVCDSTNVFSHNPGRSEATLAEPIEKLIRSAKGMVVATTFASNVARLSTLAWAGHRAGRAVCVLGRAMNTMLRAAEAAGVMDDFPPTIGADEATDLPGEHVMLLVTGSQGERRAASAQLASGPFQGLELKSGDLFLFSSKTIPGNEVGVARILNQLSEKGIDIVDDTAGIYHVSGHANRPDLVTAHTLLNPKMVIPNHGEFRHLREHAELVKSAGRNAIVAPNGAMVDITKDSPKIVDQIETGRTYLDGDVLIGAMDGVVRQRIRMALRGQVVVSLVLDDSGGAIDGAWVEALGLPESASQTSLTEMLEDQIERELERAGRKTRSSDEAVERLVSQVCNRVCKAEIGKKPLVATMISRLDVE